MQAAEVDLLAGDAAVAATKLREANAYLERIGEDPVRSTTLALLAAALLDLDEVDEAEHLTVVSRELTGDSDLVSHVLWRLALARCRARRGDAERAVELLDDALRCLQSTDYLDLRADVLMARASVLGVRSDVHRALELYEAKEHLVGAARARAVLVSA